MIRLARKSIAVQVIVPTVLLLLLAALLATRVERLTQTGPERIVADYDAIMLQAYLNTTEKGLDVNAFLGSDIVRRTRARNPDFGYFIRDNDRVYGNIRADATLERFLRRTDMPASRAPGLAVCQLTSLTRPVTATSGGRYIIYRNCDGERYYAELVNLRHPVRALPPADEDGFGERLAQRLTGHLTAILLAVLLVLIVGILIFRTFRDIAAAARAFDSDDGAVAMAVDDVAIEVRPLVGIINALAARLRAGYERQRLFLAAAAHELRTPLAILRVRVEALDDSDEKQAIRRDVQALSRIANQLLDLVGVRYRHAERQDFDLATVIEDAIEDVRGEYPHHRFRLREEGEAGWRVAGGNAQLLRVALLNLLRNAGSVSPPDTPVIAALGRDGMLRILDGGPGIDPAIADRLFDPFVKFPASRQGSGLGLAIVREIVGFHGGTIAVVPRDLGGTCFRIDLRASLRATAPG